jgi:hypothetical protein
MEDEIKLTRRELRAAVGALLWNWLAPTYGYWLAVVSRTAVLACMRPAVALSSL